ncbi:MAG: hypothetical protein ACRDRL_25850 [Sciscionella sp.]
MEQTPPPTPDEEPVQHWIDQLPETPAAVNEDAALAGAIRDAIAHAEAEGGEVPAWGARSLAQALAIRRGNPGVGPLRAFAITGEADTEAMTRELTALYRSTTNEQTREWINWLGTYVVRLAVDGPQTETRQRTEAPDGVVPDHPQVARGIREHGDAFRAYLSLSDIDAGRDDLLDAFEDFYAGAYDSMGALVNSLSEGIAIDTTPEPWASDAVTAEEMVRATWDLVEIDSTWYAFIK